MIEFVAQRRETTKTPGTQKKTKKTTEEIKNTKTAEQSRPARACRKKL